MLSALHSIIWNNLSQSELMSSWSQEYIMVKLVVVDVFSACLIELVIHVQKHAASSSLFFSHVTTCDN